ncbi:MAG: hypothetical protein J07HQX50_02492 [Haloquadratum sp. J07HQX50]|nr:MAG: hypothetical protein J07HQX50_02492 [Haloquadratum sp. J07HQX50]
MDTPNRDHAIEALASRDYLEAGNYYMRSAYARLSGESERGRDLFTSEGGNWSGYALESMLLATVCSQIAGNESRARGRAGQGILIASDLRDTVLSQLGLQAGCEEWVGLFRAVTQKSERANAAFERAETRYGSVESSEKVELTTEPLLQASERALRQISRPDDFQWDDMHGSAPSNALSRRIQFIRSRVPTFMKSRLDAGHLHAPRGSTEYGNEKFRCPDCGSHDINYVADTVLCLRCDTPTNRID